MIAGMPATPPPLHPAGRLALPSPAQALAACHVAVLLFGFAGLFGKWIAWDAIDKQIRSFSFYSGGGFGEAVWSKDDNKWSVKTTARTANGQKVSATNVVTKTDNDHVTWQMTKLIVDGKSLPDPKPVKMKRVKES